MENKKKRNPAAEQNPIICALIGSGISIAVMIVSALLLSFAALKFNDPNVTVMPLSCFCAFVGALSGGFVSAKKCGRTMVQVGLMSAGITVLPMILISLVIPGGLKFVSALIIILMIVSASALASYMVMKMNGSRKRNMKKAMKRR